MIAIAALLCPRMALGAPALIWDAPAKTIVVAPGETQAALSFTAVNASDAEIVLTAVSTSCRCTRAVLSSMPCRIAPGASTVLQVVVALAPDATDVSQTIFVESNAGSCRLAASVRRPSSPKRADAR